MPKPISFLSDDEWPGEGFHVTLPVRVETAGLCLVDLQNYCLDPRSDLAHTVEQTHPALFEAYRNRVDAAVANAARLLQSFRRAQRPVLFTRHGVLRPDGGDLILRRRERERAARAATGGVSGHLPLRGTHGHEIAPQLQPGEGDLVLDKNTSSAFHSTAIDLFLRNLGVETLVMAGIATDMCVLTTALDAADRGFHVIVAGDACATFDPGSHEAALLLFRRTFGEVRDTASLCEWIGDHPDRAG